MPVVLSPKEHSGSEPFPNPPYLCHLSAEDIADCKLGSKKEALGDLPADSISLQHTGNQ